MTKLLSIFCGGVLAVVLVVGACWAWIDGGRLALRASEPQTMLWAARAMAIAAASGAQIILLTFVIGRTYAHRAGHDALRLLAAVICSVSSVGAAALGLVARG